MEDFSKYRIFKIKKKEVAVLSVLTDNGINTIAEIDKQNYYLGDVPPDITAAIKAYQMMTGIDLTDQEMDQILIDN
jgi:hypothetical protein